MVVANQILSIMNNNNKNNEAPILIPKDSYVEGYIKSVKSIRLECAFHGTILTKSKVIVDKASAVTGDIICEKFNAFWKSKRKCILLGKGDHK